MPMRMTWLFVVTQYEMRRLVSDWSPNPWSILYGQHCVSVNGNQ